MSEQPKQPNLAFKKAVALKYDPGQGEAPVVAAKGSGLLAERILETAKEHGIPVQEDAALVEVLSKLDLDQQIPAELYDLVAEILTFIYRSDKMAERRMFLE
ncbi:MAG: EscU/YscU/HrcU family type III secretion system export apparatus switch protein [Paenibacillus macerans]|uniref:FhlB domain-containing protein n=1 Tax=Paenibacillus macerans TaxID=44252 RepID=A0A090ZI09_PAEMA|nr:EscU/YscU/HrcU family type III secretion system export apparatus switch protein [Paenibacillus macerans]KFN10964.1 flhB HrpN YscU SpaS family protein [Paenibacillus macerans]MBS5910915.1 EscU/YscU/HrcU family type III secretion system export apparatus switch protein [Paenibacillus macerans]MCY7562097.1 EscU/YscU/HrcU family type III secretion system export apparatus switch protein [Paenibacillus macerans]MDU7476799.1 EscU/YscU/HrcU family type III secretion system export apparatus switch pro